MKSITMTSHRMPGTCFSKVLQAKVRTTILLSTLLAAFGQAPAFADETADVTRLLRAGQHAEAMAKADAFLGKNPHDLQMRFLKGVILTEQNKTADAIAVFSRLTEEFPALPEPYNNLAVLYAGAGQYDKARVALDAAIRTNPTYATAYENLGDVHARLASQAYDKALQLDSGNSGAKSKLTLVRTLVTTSGIAQKAPSAAAAAPAPAPAPAAAPSAAAKVPPAAPVPQHAAAAPAPDQAKTAPKPAPEAPIKPTPSAPLAKADPKTGTKPEPQQHAGGESEEVLNTVNAWARAWSSRNVKAYLGHYGDDFVAPNGQSRASWEAERQARIAGKGRIDVKVEDPRVEVNGNSATVKFRQVYVSDRLTANTHKTLQMTRHGGKWQIRQEQANK